MSPDPLDPAPPTTGGPGPLPTDPGQEALDLAPVRELVALFKAAGHRAAQDPSDLTPPGVLVQLSGFNRHTLGGLMRPEVRVFAVVPDGNHARTSVALVNLANELLELVDPDGDVTATSVVFPATATPLPALVFPLHLY